MGSCASPPALLQALCHGKMCWLILASAGGGDGEAFQGGEGIPGGGGQGAGGGSGTQELGQLQAPLSAQSCARPAGAAAALPTLREMFPLAPSSLTVA